MTYKQYPKPLSEKSLKKMYSELHLSDEQVDFLKQFILACTNLYGSISIRDIWGVYKELGKLTTVPKVKRTDIVSLSSVLRREELPYFVYEIDELYCEEPRSDLNREFVSKYLVGNGSGKFSWYYDVAEAQTNYDYFVPENLLSFACPVAPAQEKELLDFVSELKVTADEYENNFGRILKCPDYKGQTLNSFSFMNDMERFDYMYAAGEIEGVKGNPKEAQRLLEESRSMNEAEKIIDRLKWYGNIGHVTPIEMIKYTTDELGEAGVELTKQQLEKLLNGIMDMHNHSHLMCMCGWSPADLAERTKMPKAITFGPGIKKAIADGVLDKDELVSSIRAMGLEYVEK